MMIIDHHRLLFFARVSKTKGKKHEDDNFVPSSFCLKGTRTGGGGEDEMITNCCCLLFFTRMTKAKKK